MANSGANTNGSQFFITADPTRWLDGKHTIFGFLVQGDDIRQKLDAVATNSNDKPLNSVLITSASIITDTHDAVLRLASPTGSTGTATVTVTATDTITKETATRTFTVYVEPDVGQSNHAPALTAASTSPSSGITDLVTPKTINISSFINNGAGTTTVTDSDTGAVVGGIAITGLTGLGTWKYSLDGTNYVAIDKATIGNSSALLLSKDAKLLYTPDGTHAETPQVSYQAWDMTAGNNGSRFDVANAYAGATAFSSTSDKATLTVVNTAPVLVQANPSSIIGPSLGAITNEKPTIINVASFLNKGAGTTTINDPDPGAIVGGIAILTTSGPGTWEYSLSATGDFQSLTASEASALLLPKEARLRYTPDHQNPTSSNATISYRAWDMTSGVSGGHVDLSRKVNNVYVDVGGTTAFSEKADAAQLIINDAPTLTPAANHPSMGTTDENSAIVILLNKNFVNNGTTTTQILDMDTDDKTPGIAIIGLTGKGKWEYALTSAPSAQFIKIDTSNPIGPSTALILTMGAKLRYTPDNENGETPTITYRGWDMSSGTNGQRVDLSQTSSVGGATPFSSESDTAILSVTAVNDAPVLTPGSPAPVVMGKASNDSAVTIPLTNFINTTKGTTIADVDTGDVKGGIAITGITGNGTWEYSLNGTDFTIIIKTTIGDTTALLLPKDAKLKYTLGSDNTVTASITYRAWDATAGTAGTFVDTSTAGGTTAFSTLTDTAELIFNNAPILASASPTLPNTDENTPTNFALTAFIGDTITDGDTGAVVGGIALIDVDGKGTWAYSLDDGKTYININGATVSDSAALLLPKNAKLQYTPDNKNGEKNGETPFFNYRAWDTTTGTAGEFVDISAADAIGGASAFSEVANKATFTVTDVNDSPVLTAANPILGVKKNTEKLDINLAAFINSNSGTGITDVDNGAVIGGIAVVGITGNGTWAYSLDGTNYVSITDVGEAKALLLPHDAKLRYTPSIDHETATIKYRAWDTTSGTAEAKVDLSGTDATGGTTAFSSATDTGTVYVNDAPVLTVANPSLGTVKNSEPTTIVVGTFINNGTGTTTISDPNETTFAGGIALIGITGNGTWAYSLDDGKTFTNIEKTISKSSALLLPKNAILRYSPTGTVSEAPTIKYIAWDQTTGQAGVPVNLTVTDSTKGATAFSDIDKPDTATLTVRSAPTAISLDNQKINDNSAIGTKVGSLSSTAPAGGTFTYSLVSGTGSTDNASFIISGNELKTAVKFNAGIKGSYTIRVRTTDQVGLVFEQSFTITLTDVTSPTVKINQQVGQDDPAHGAVLYFVVQFSEPVTDFTKDDVILSGTAPGMKVQKITGSGRNYEVQVGGMTGSGTVIANILAGKAHDAANNANAASTSDDNTVQYTYNWATYAGTSRDDMFVFSPGATPGTWQVMVNSTIWAIPATTQGISIDGFGGNDRIKIVGTASNQNLQISSDGGTFMAGNFEVDFANLESYALGDLLCTISTTSQANDTIIMYGVAGSAGAKTFTASPTSAVLSLNGHSINATNFANVQAYIQSGNGDTATFTDSTGNDLYLVSPIGADMFYRGNNTEVSAWGFSNVSATAATGSDEVRFYGKSGAKDTFVASSTEATYTNANFVNKASGFDDVQAYIDPNNESTATLLGTAGNDRAVTSPLGAQMFATGFQSSAWNFKHLNVQSNGGIDTADMYGYYPGEVNPLKNTLLADSQSAVQSGGCATGTFNNSVSGFTTIKAYGNSATSDSVTLDNATFETSDKPLDGNPYSHKLVLNSIDELFTTKNKANPTPHAIDLVMKGYWE
jgi:hypothetical protein